MTRARSSIIDLETTSYYHCISRCVRRAFLCGEDSFSGRNYEHRREWIVERIAYLLKSFSIEVASYAVMSNHYHLVLRVDKEKAQSWSEANIVRRWKRLFKIPEVVKRYMKEPAAPGYAEVARDVIKNWRNRLTDISWFMRGLNEYLARKANHEDNCTGRFWEGRFKSQPLLDEAAVLTAMSYVDLNPIRAKMAKTPEDSDYTSVQQRIRKQQNVNIKSVIKLMSLSANRHVDAIQFKTKDYLELVDWLGRAILPKKRGYIAKQTPPIIERLNLEKDEFINLMKSPEDLSGLSVIGSPVVLTHFLANAEQKFIKGQSGLKKLFI